MSRVSQPHVRFTVDEFFRLVEADALGTSRVELLNGRIYRMAPQAIPHLVAVSKGSRALGKVVPDHEWLIIQGTIKLDQFSAPDPDLMWLPCPQGTGFDAWPSPLLVIEASDTTYRRDSGVKLRSYAYHGIADYWIENLRAGRIEVYRQPKNPTGKLRDCHYESVEHFPPGQAIPLLLRPAVSLQVDDLLP
jgi:Uma2 family endonuclease